MLLIDNCTFQMCYLQGVLLFNYHQYLKTVAVFSEKDVVFATDISKELICF